jgi:hypothetical protein
LHLAGLACDLWTTVDRHSWVRERALAEVVSLSLVFCAVLCLILDLKFETRFLLCEENEGEAVIITVIFVYCTARQKLGANNEKGDKERVALCVPCEKIRKGGKLRVYTLSTHSLSSARTWDIETRAQLVRDPSLPCPSLADTNLTEEPWSRKWKSSLLPIP